MSAKVICLATERAKRRQPDPFAVWLEEWAAMWAAFWLGGGK